MSSVNKRFNDPFLLSMWLIQQAQSDLIRFHSESRSNFINSNCFIIIFIISVMSKSNQVIMISKGNNPLTSQFRHREQMLKNMSNPIA
jgi:hypothetical protein